MPKNIGDGISDIAIGDLLQEPGARFLFKSL